MVQKILFVCTANMDRSPTAEDLLKHKEGFNVRSAGTWQNARKRVTEQLTDWADLIFVMENRHKESLLFLNPRIEDKIIVLNIPDIYLRNDPELIGILKEKISKHLHIHW